MAEDRKWYGLAKLTSEMFKIMAEGVSTIHLGKIDER
jgi:hypothetical protein